MPLSTPAHLQQFKQIIDPWKGAYRFATCACVAIKAGDITPILVGRILLDFTPPEQSQSFNLDTEHLIAHKFVIPIPHGQIDNLIDQISNGNIVSKEKQFSLKQDGEYLGSTLFLLHHPEVTMPGIRVPTLRVSGATNEPFLRSSSFRNVDHIDWTLRASEQPFESLDELLRWLGLPTLEQLGNLTAIEAVAFSPTFLLDTSHIHEGCAVVSCRTAKGIDANKIRLGYKILRPTTTDRSMTTGDMFEWTDKNVFFKDGVISIDTADGLALQAFLSYEGRPLHQWWISDPDKRLNRRQALYEIFDHNLTVLKSFINGEGREKSKDFEKGVSFLTHLLGFDILPLNVTPLLSDGPDLIISTPSNNIAVVECTIRHLDEDNKLAKLIQRTTLVREKLKTTGLDHLKVQPVIVSLLTRPELQGELVGAGRLGVAVISREDLQVLLNETIIYPKADDLFSRLSQYIPPPSSLDDQESLFTTQMT